MTLKLLLLGMLKKVALLFMILAFATCGNKETGLAPPADLLNKNAMAEVMKDIGMAEAVINMKTMQNPAFTADSLVKFNIFKQHNITRKQFESNIHYYSAHPKEFKEVYDIVVKKLEAMNK